MNDSGLQFGGEELFEADPARLFAVVTDLDVLPRVIPDVDTSERVGDTTLKCVVRPGFSFLRGKLKLEIQVTDQQPPRSAVTRALAKGIGVRIVVESRLEITATDDGSRLSWQATVTERKGLIATVSIALVRAAADQVIRTAWQRVRAELSE